MSRIKVSIIALALVGAACSAAPGPDVVEAELYRASCARCHGADLGGGIGPALDSTSNAATALDDAQLAGAIRVGPGAMPAFGQLTDAQIDSLVEYLRERQAGG